MNQQEKSSKRGNQTDNEDSQASYKHVRVYCAKCPWEGGKNNIKNHFDKQHNGGPVQMRAKDEVPEDPDFVCNSQRWSKSHQPTKSVKTGDLPVNRESFKRPVLLKSLKQVAALGSDGDNHYEHAPITPLNSMSQSHQMIVPSLSPSKVLQSTSELNYDQPGVAEQGEALTLPNMQTQQAIRQPISQQQTMQQTMSQEQVMQLYQVFLAQHPQILQSLRIPQNLQANVTPSANDPKQPSAPKHKGNSVKPGRKDSMNDAERKHGCKSENIGCESDESENAMNLGLLQGEIMSELTSVQKLECIIMQDHTMDELKAYLLDNADLFIDADVISYVRRKPMRLGRALSAMKPVPQTTTTGRVGLVIALIMHGEEYLQLLPRYYKALNSEMRKDFDEMLVLKLQKVFSNDGVCKWIVENLERLDETNLDWAWYLNNQENQQAHQVLQATRICRLDCNREKFIFVCKNFIRSGRWPWVEQSLSNHPNQDKISYNQFLRTQLKLHEEDKFPLLEAKQSLFEQAVVDEWDCMVDDQENQAPCYNQTSYKYDDVLNALKAKKACPASALTRLAPQHTDYLFANVKNEPSDMQKAISAYCIAQLPKFGRQMWQLGCGMGKGRIIPRTAVLALLDCRDIEQVQILVPPNLTVRDYQNYQDYFTTYEDKVHYHSELSFEINRKHLLLIDETDFFMFTDPAKFAEYTSKMPTICFSATVEQHEDSQVEKQVLEAMGFANFSYSFRGETETSKLTFTRTLEPMSQEALITFVQNKAKTKAVLLYTTPETVQQVKAKCQDALEIDHHFKDWSHHQSIKDLSIKVNQSFRILVTSYANALRGLDYRAKEHGICLIVDNGFDTQRDVQQALARVGRDGDLCERFITDGTQKVNQIKYRALVDNMKLFVLNHKQQKSSLNSEKKEEKKRQVKASQKDQLQKK